MELGSRWYGKDRNDGVRRGQGWCSKRKNILNEPDILGRVVLVYERIQARVGMMGNVIAKKGTRTRAAFNF